MVMMAMLKVAVTTQESQGTRNSTDNEVLTSE